MGFQDPELDTSQVHKGSFGASPWQLALSLSWLGGLHAAPLPCLLESVSLEVTMATPLFLRPGPVSRLPPGSSSAEAGRTPSQSQHVCSPSNSGLAGELGPAPATETLSSQPHTYRAQVCTEATGPTGAAKACTHRPVCHPPCPPLLEKGNIF